MTKSYTTGNGEFFESYSPWLILGVGFVLLALVIAQATHVREPEALRKKAWHLGAEISAYALGALLLLWVGAPIASLRGEPTLQTLERRIEVPLDLDATTTRLHRAFRDVELHVDVDQRLLVRDRRTGEEALRVVLHRAQRAWAFDRFVTSFAGPRRVSPQIWATVVPRAGQAGTTILLRAGQYDSRSDAGETADVLLTRLQAALRAD